MPDIRFKGCADFTVLELILVPFAEGSTVFVCAKARIGEFEKIVIKQFKVLKSHKTWGKVVIQYFDTHNRLWFAHELCEEEDAIASAQLYYESLAAKVSALECPPN